MSKQKRTPWFNAKEQPPVNGGGSAMYEWRCIKYCREIDQWSKRQLISYSCSKCRWRGLTKPAGKK